MSEENGFRGLRPELLRLLDEAGIDAPSDIQTKAIPRIMEGDNVLVVAPTGVGKTESAVLPIFHRILEDNPDPVCFLYITPLRALNRDMLQRFESWGDELGIKVAVRHGDTTQSERAKQVRKPPHMLITTPETLQVMLTGSRLREMLSNVRFVVVDEIHELASDERGAQMSIGLERLERYAPGFQRIGISATVSNPREVADFLAGPHEATIVKVPMPKNVDISLHLVKPSREDRRMAVKLSCSPELAGAIRRILDYIDTSNSMLIFVNTREAAEGMASRIAMLGREEVGVHHGSLSKEIRESMEDSFKAGELKALICTSSLELGIDIGSIDTVIQYNSPRQVSRFTQRIGRSGHGLGRTSRGILMCTSIDEAMESAIIARRAGFDLTEPIEVRENPRSVLANQLTIMTLEHRWKIDEAFGLVRQAYPFRTLSREQFDRVLESLVATGTVAIEGSEIRAHGARHYFLENISMIPDTRTFRIRDAVTRRWIGVLDEKFVVNHLGTGATFIMKGLSWKVEEIEDRDILVSGIKDVAPLPSWVGEEIPVPYEVAQEVGRFRVDLAETEPIDGEDDDGSDEGPTDDETDAVEPGRGPSLGLPDGH